jgi:hypothetical protein
MTASKKQYRIQNWSDYNQSLVQRGSITFWISKDVAQGWQEPKLSGKKGASKTYTDLAIVTPLMIRSVYGLTLRATQGFVDSLFSLMKLDIKCPHYTRLSRRAKTLDAPLPRSRGIQDVVVDASGLKVFGEGEWKVRQHGVSKRRTWRKVHFAINPDNNEIVASVLSSSDVSDGETLGELLDQIPGDLRSVAGDGAYDTVPCHREIHKSGAQPLIPPRRNAVIHEKDDILHHRNKAIERIHSLGNDEGARKQWKEEMGYHKRSLAETGMFRLKTLFGDKLSSRIFETQATELFVKAAALNMMASLGMPESYCI